MPMPNDYERTEVRVGDVRVDSEYRVVEVKDGQARIQFMFDLEPWDRWIPVETLAKDRLVSREEVL